jgi:hypothetical protein
MTNLFLKFSFLSAVLAVSLGSTACSKGAGAKKSSEALPKEDAEATRKKIQEYRDAQKGKGSTMTTESKAGAKPQKKVSEKQSTENSKDIRRVEVDSKTTPAGGTILRFNVNPGSNSVVSSGPPQVLLPQFQTDSDRLAYLYQMTYQSNGSSVSSSSIRVETSTPRFETLEQRFADLAKIEGKYSAASMTSTTAGTSLSVLERVDIEVRGEVMTVDVRLPGCEGALNYRIVRADGKFLSLRWESTEGLKETSGGCALIAPLGIIGDSSIEYVLNESALYLKNERGFLPLIRR